VFGVYIFILNFFYLCNKTDFLVFVWRNIILGPLFDDRLVSVVVGAGLWVVLPCAKKLLPRAMLMVL
jgi:hypothetical protein